MSSFFCHFIFLFIDSMTFFAPLLAFSQSSFAYSPLNTHFMVNNFGKLFTKKEKKKQQKKKFKCNAMP